jgi:hypothetical protein
MLELYVRFKNKISFFGFFLGLLAWVGDLLPCFCRIRVAYNGTLGFFANGCTGIERL